jgi:hypothetical protein
MKRFSYIGMSIFLIAIVFVFMNFSNNDRDVNLLAGMYKLHSIETQDSEGKWIVSDWGKGGESYIIYDGLGHMAVQITPKGYGDFKWFTEEQAIDDKFLKEKIDKMSTNELKSAVAEFASNYVYVANYTVDEKASLITHKRLISTIPAIWNTQVKRKFSFSGDTIILRNPNANRILKWVRQK